MSIDTALSWFAHQLLRRQTQSRCATDLPIPETDVPYERGSAGSLGHLVHELVMRGYCLLGEAVPIPGHSEPGVLLTYLE
jgi:hypothetical protein